MEEHGNPNQWGKTNPPRCLLEEDIRKNNLYTIRLGENICGVFAFILGEDPTYHVIHDGAWRDCRPYGTIHRIAGNGSGGLLHACVSYCSSLIDYLRIDTHEDNIVMQGAIRKEGFQRCGTIYIADGTPRIAYDRI